MKKISIIVPVYNVEKYLKKCLDSLVNQTLSDIEIIVVNDGSPDKSQVIIDEYQKKYPTMIKSFKKKNGGLSDARNYGIEKAIGEFIAFVDSDDWVELDMYEKMYNYAQKNKLDLVTCNIKLVYESEPEKLMTPLAEGFVTAQEYITLQPQVAWNKIIKKSIFVDNPNFRFPLGKWYEDIALMPALVLHTDKIGCINEYGYNYLQRQASITHSEKFDSRFMDVVFDLEYLEDFFNEAKKRECFFEEIEYLYIISLLYTTSLRLIKYPEGRKIHSQVIAIMKEKFPNWRKNKYYKKDRGFKYKTICNLLDKRIYFILNFYNKFKRS